MSIMVCWSSLFFCIHQAIEAAINPATQIHLPNWRSPDAANIPANVGVSRKLLIPENTKFQKLTNQDGYRRKRMAAHEIRAVVKPASIRQFRRWIPLRIRSGRVRITRWGFMVVKIRLAPARKLPPVLSKYMKRASPARTNVLTCPYLIDSSVGEKIRTAKIGTHICFFVLNQRSAALIRMT